MTYWNNEGVLRKFEFFTGIVIDFESNFSQVTFCSPRNLTIDPKDESSNTTE